MLSTINSIFDPLGFLAPAIVSGRIILRVVGKADWDVPLSEPLSTKWEEWKSSLMTVEELSFPRMYTTTSWSEYGDLKIHIFSDASEKAIAAVAYVQSPSVSDTIVGFLMGKSKLTPSGGTTIPRLCAAVLATSLAETIKEQFNVSSDAFEYYTDSRVVLGYINNRTRRFYTYVSNRVHAILRSSQPTKWHYVSTQNNPADCGTR